jgi:hypothetical protein
MINPDIFRIDNIITITDLSDTRIEVYNPEIKIGSLLYISDFRKGDTTAFRRYESRIGLVKEGKGVCFFADGYEVGGSISARIERTQRRLKAGVAIQRTVCAFGVDSAHTPNGNAGKRGFQIGFSRVKLDNHRCPRGFLAKLFAGTNHQDKQHFQGMRKNFHSKNFDKNTKSLLFLQKFSFDEIKGCYHFWR